jgi:predicted SprT family Zn-dependent metalloprotease
VKKLILTFLILSLFPKFISPAVPDPLEIWYQAYNVKLFNNELPTNVVIDHDLHDNRFMAVTDYDFQQKYWHLSFNPKYGPSLRQECETEIHEMCHIRVATLGELEIEDHGPKWQYCMHQVADKNGFNDLW